ncbi:MULTISPECIES: tRNA (adenosine(37)-N6)-threonylcarbamoyltransferase complex ATPase subunit type 1 TsaE [Sporosarcina]|uniref:tRNA (adenosine(37)-N6)-threonylcarbamoyltransferase complex ATPase subunit type 1 TsaE n=1 Tax=Sporosarcina TaxID=1569 RepID=UPI00058F781E|nr:MULTISPECIES: tRNA (adenosine(37)-N6)-threonylcarbamoyltransferase complex ATPase subunit type 1 TsaE [Sporosarcina]WJY27187.1 tRNA (adenosine(37)-N6)-threonylcarbamoyltransferase complex ATPase subunit type 1 TsaE [Sporosarcina sp. 0.2-SM1T-5]
MKKEFHTASVAETQALAEQLAAHLVPPDVLTLEGDLGAGKTTFTQALVRALGVSRTVSSPTFTIIKQYDGTYPVNHLDVYRLEDSEEDLGWEELFYGDAISIVEWAGFIAEELPDERLNIRIRRTGNTSRLIELEPAGMHFTKICEAISK